jgi:hypothetical protein
VVADRPDLVVTGISRSGTSYLCNLLHRLDNCVAINEPAEVIGLLKAERVPRALPAFYATLRREILAGRPIENKLVDGEVVEDTAVFQARSRYTPAVASDDFVLAVKNTREFLLRLGAVRRVMPWARIVLCVRNPYDTIASWKGSFEHLRVANVRPFTQHRRQMWLPWRQRRELAQIAATEPLPERRALWWRFLAERALEHRADGMLVHYEDLVAAPEEALAGAVEGYRAGAPTRPVEPSVVRSRRELLDGDDLRAIGAICSEAAAELGCRMPAR